MVPALSNSVSDLGLWYNKKYTCGDICGPRQQTDGSLSLMAKVIGLDGKVTDGSFSLVIGTYLVHSN